MGVGGHLKTKPKQSLLHIPRARKGKNSDPHKQKVTHETWIHSTVRNGTVPLSNTARVNRKRPVATFGPGLYGFKSRRTQPFDPSLGGSIRNETIVGSQPVPLVACSHWLCVRMSISSSSGRCCSSWRPSAIDTYAHAPQGTRPSVNVRLRYMASDSYPFAFAILLGPGAELLACLHAEAIEAAGLTLLAQKVKRPQLFLKQTGDLSVRSTAREDRPITSQPRQGTVRQCDKAH